MIANKFYEVVIVTSWLYKSWRKSMPRGSFRSHSPAATAARGVAISTA